jgi:hypothetical protein
MEAVVYVLKHRRHTVGAVQSPTKSTPWPDATHTMCFSETHGNDMSKPVYIWEAHSVLGRRSPKVNARKAHPILPTLQLLT